MTLRTIRVTMKLISWMFILTKTVRGKKSKNSAVTKMHGMKS